MPTQEQQVYDYVASRGARGATSEEIEMALDIRHQAASARLNSLSKRMSPPLLMVGGYRKTRAGKDARVYVVPEGLCEHGLLPIQCLVCGGVQ